MEDKKNQEFVKFKKITYIIIAVLLIGIVILLFNVIKKNPKNSADKSAENISNLSKADVGDVVKFGSYEQDNDTSNGKEEIEWIVLEKEDKRMLLISKYALDCQQYNKSFARVTWENCSLRSWLNSRFLGEAFSGKEKSVIKSSKVNADKNPQYDITPGEKTTDKVFIFSAKEMNEYFGSNEERQCQGTAYCYAQNAYRGDGGNCWYWLRSPGHTEKHATTVYPAGNIDFNGRSVAYDNYSVRPAIWVKI